MVPTVASFTTIGMTRFMSKFELFPKEWKATHAGHEIRVRNSWTTGIKLFVDDVCYGSSNNMFALNKKVPFLRAEVKPAQGEPFVVELMAFALLTVKVKILVDGKQLAGDKL